jgi:hypothetical protein
LRVKKFLFHRVVVYQKTSGAFKADTIQRPASSSTSRAVAEQMQECFNA